MEVVARSIHITEATMILLLQQKLLEDGQIQVSEAVREISRAYHHRQDDWTYDFIITIR